jgi:hypothetical protein
LPNRFRSDSAPQFAARAFQQFLRRWGLAPATSSPHYPHGHAEAALKVMEKVMAAQHQNGDACSR